MIPCSFRSAMCWMFSLFYQEYSNYKRTTKHEQSVWQHSYRASETRAMLEVNQAVQTWVHWTLVLSLRVCRKQHLHGRNIGMERESTYLYIHCNPLEFYYFSLNSTTCQRQELILLYQRHKLYNYYRLIISKHCEVSVQVCLIHFSMYSQQFHIVYSQYILSFPGRQ